MGAGMARRIRPSATTVKPVGRVEDGVELGIGEREWPGHFCRRFLISPQQLADDGHEQNESHGDEPKPLCSHAALVRAFAGGHAD
jgi:hypothetical protein